MRYRFKFQGRVIEVRSENAALSFKRPSKKIRKYLSSFEGVDSALDYGCGKLRYTDDLRQISNTVIVVDSIEQLSRRQAVRGKTLSVYDYLRKNWNDVNAETVEQFSKSRTKYDFILCANVLSAVPSKKVVDEILKKLKKHLTKKGKCLIINQHRNSRFKKWESEATPHAYGWIYHGKRGHSYFGIINKKVLERALFKTGLKVNRIWVDGQSTYALCENKE